MENNRDQALEMELAALKKDHDKLKEDKVRTEQDLANVRAQLEKLQARARDEYGTDDPEKLRALLAEKRAENEKLVAGYREHIAGVKQSLENLERE